MDETGLIVTACSATATVCAAFWARTEFIASAARDRSDELKKWVDEKYMTREAVNLKFDAIQQGQAALRTSVDAMSSRVDSMEKRQRVQIGLLTRIDRAVNGPNGKSEDEEINGTDQT